MSALCQKRTFRWEPSLVPMRGIARGGGFSSYCFLSALDTFHDSHRTQTRRRGIARATCHRRLGCPSTASRPLFLIFLAFSVKSFHCCQTTGLAAVGNCVLPEGNCAVILLDASLMARASGAIRSNSLLLRSRLLIASRRLPMSVINSIRSRTTPVACSCPSCASAAFETTMPTATITLGLIRFST